MKFNILQPDYYENFQCKGGNCHYNCCQEWQIFYSSKEHQKIKNAKKSEKLEEIIKKSFVKFHKSKINGADYKIVYQNDQLCPCLDEEGMCQLQKECTFHVLPSACKIFPRLVVRYLDGLERHMSLGCEKVIELLLQQPDGVNLISIEEEINESEILYSHEINKHSIKYHPVLEYFYDIKTLAMAVLENRDFLINERLLLLGMGFKQICHLKDYSAVPELVNGFLDSLDDRKLLEPFGQLKINRMLRVMDCIGYLEKLFFDKNLWFHEVKERMYHNLNVQFQKDNNVVTMSYDHELFEKNQKKLNEFLNGREYILENIIITFFFTGNFPFWKERDIWEEYLYFISCFNIYYCLLVGCMDEEFNEERFIFYTAATFRELAHKDSLRKTVTITLEANKSNTLAHMALLLL